MVYHSYILEETYEVQNANTDRLKMAVIYANGAQFGAKKIPFEEQLKIGLKVPILFNVVQLPYNNRILQNKLNF